jgi:hypothetical protein
VHELVGRDDEQVRIEALLEQATSRSTALLIEGDPGIGKTVLWRFGVERATTAGFQILGTQPAEAETKLTYAGLADLLMPFTDSIGSLPPDPSGFLLGSRAESREIHAIDRLEYLAPDPRREEIARGAGGIRNPRRRVPRELDR